MPEFSTNAIEIARTTMDSIYPGVTEEYVTVISFLIDNPLMAAQLRGRRAPQPGTEEYIERMAENFARGHLPRSPSRPSTIPDPAVAMVMKAHYGIREDAIDQVVLEHQLAMASENLVGFLLERYIAANIEDAGWTWCAGELVKHVDFVRWSDEGWESLQVKNRSNSENSSSSAIRNGTPIQKWHRLNANSGANRWSEFPARSAHHVMNEDDFLNSIEDYFQQMRLE